jgi:hypothetical protein
MNLRHKTEIKKERNKDEQYAGRETIGRVLRHARTRPRRENRERNRGASGCEHSQEFARASRSR